MRTSFRRAVISAMTEAYSRIMEFPAPLSRSRRAAHAHAFREPRLGSPRCSSWDGSGRLAGVQQTTAPDEQRASERPFLSRAAFGLEAGVVVAGRPHSLGQLRRLRVAHSESRYRPRVVGRGREVPTRTAWTAPMLCPVRRATSRGPSSRNMTVREAAATVRTTHAISRWLVQTSLISTADRVAVVGFNRCASSSPETRVDHGSRAQHQRRKCPRRFRSLRKAADFRDPTAARRVVSRGLGEVCP